MDLDDEFDLGHLVLHERKCRVCNQTKSLTDGFYLTRKNRGVLPSSYSYECKSCTIRRVKSKRKRKKPEVYPDW